MFRSRNSDDTLFDLIARKRYSKAIAIVREQLAERPDSPQLRMQLADLLVLQNSEAEAGEATAILARLADELASGGFVAKAVAVLKKMQRIDPDRPGLEERLARLIKQQQDELSGIRPAPSAAMDLLTGAEVSAESDAAPDLETNAMTEPVTAALEPVAGLDRSRLFAGFSADELVAVIRGLDLLSFAPGAIVFTEGEPGASLMVLASGTVRVFVKDGEGRNRELRKLSAGEIFGEISLLTEMPRTATITAADDCEVLELDRDAVGEIATVHPNVRDVLRELCLARAGSDEEMAIRGEGGAS